jgi:hypothetical protein
MWHSNPKEKDRVIDARGNVLTPMLAEAQAMAVQQWAELVHLANDLGMRISGLLRGGSGERVSRVVPQWGDHPKIRVGQCSGAAR